VLTQTSATVAVERSSKSKPLSDAEAQALLSSVSEVVLSRGKKSVTQPAKDTSLEDLRGPTGGFRAPMLKIGRRLYVGFHEETLRGALAV